MSDFFAPLDRLMRQARGLAAGLRPRHLAAAAAVAVIGVGVAGVRAVAFPGPEPARDSARIQIEVVDPVEPEINPGSVMDVGELVDGFEYTPPARPVAEPVAYSPYDDDFGPSKRRPKSAVQDAWPVIHAPPQPEARAGERRAPRDDRADRWFGFDVPERDYRAEREARRARRDAREARDRARDWRRDQDPRHRDQDRREMRRYPSGGAEDRWE